MSLHSILLVEDDALLAEGIQAAFEEAGYDVDRFQDGKLAFEALMQRDYSAVILDINLPSKDGLTILRDARGRGNSVPILLLTARDSIDDCVGGLNLGADDYLTKPFDLAELEARIRALTRRKSNEIEHEIVIGQLHFDVYGRRATIDGKPVDLSARETDLLEMLLARRGKVVSKEDVLDKMFGIDCDVGLNAVEVIVHRLRKKCSGAGIQLNTLRGMGYVLEGGQ